MHDFQCCVRCTTFNAACDARLSMLRAMHDFWSLFAPSETVTNLVLWVGESKVFDRDVVLLGVCFAADVGSVWIFMVVVGRTLFFCVAPCCASLPIFFFKVGELTRYHRGKAYNSTLI